MNIPESEFMVYQRALHEITTMCLHVPLDHSLTLSYNLSYDYAKMIYNFIIQHDLGCFGQYAQLGSLATFKISHPLCNKDYCKQCNVIRFQSFHVYPTTNH